LTHPNPFRFVSPRYARLHSTEWIGMNLQKEVYTPDFLQLHVSNVIDPDRINTA
jgi:hypothetical protein